MSCYNGPEEYDTPEEWIAHLGELAEAEGKVSSVLGLYIDAAGRGAPLTIEEVMEGVPVELQDQVREALATVQVLLTPEVIEEVRDGLLESE